MFALRHGGLIVISLLLLRYIAATVYFLEITGVSPDPVNANSTLSVTVNSDSDPIPVSILLNCTTKEASFPATSNAPTQIQVPANFSGLCTLEATATEASYIQVNTANVTVITSIAWITPLENTYLLAGSDIIGQVDLGDPDFGYTFIFVQLKKNSQTALLRNIAPFDPFLLHIPTDYSRGPANLIATSYSPYIQPNATIPVFINASVSFLTPTEGSTFYKDVSSSIPVQLYASDGLAVSGSVLMSCEGVNGPYSISQTVQSAEPAYFVIPSLFVGICTVEITSLIDEYTVIATGSSVQVGVTYSSAGSPTGGPYYPLTYDQLLAFALSVTSTGPFSDEML